MARRGIQVLHCYCVDNCLVKVGDPLFIGYCYSRNSDVGAKCIKKLDSKEQVGLICLKNTKPNVIEYSEIPKELAEKRMDNGDLVLNCANIANHYYTLDFLCKISSFEHLLEYHVARKKIKNFKYDGSIEDPVEPNGIKLELFIFDVFPFTTNFSLLMVDRELEFSPLKNKTGNDSPITSKRDILAKHKKMVENVGGKVEGEVEISPLVSYDGEGLESLKNKTVSGLVDSL